MSRAEGVKSHLRQLLMGLYQAYLMEGLSQGEAKQKVGEAIMELIEEWKPIEDAVKPTLSPLPLVKTALDEAVKVSGSGSRLYRTLLDLYHTLGGK